MLVDGERLDGVLLALEAIAADLVENLHQLFGGFHGFLLGHFGSFPSV